MSILSSVTSILELLRSPGSGVLREESKPTEPDDGKQSTWNDDHNGRDEYAKNGDKDDESKLSGKEDSSKHGTGDYSKHDGGWKEAEKDGGRPYEDDGRPQKDSGARMPSDDGGKDDTYGNPGEALAKFDFSHGDFGSHGSDHSGDMLGALASMSSDDALEFAIGQMGPADHFDGGHFDVAADTSHDTDA